MSSVRIGFCSAKPNTTAVAVLVDGASLPSVADLPDDLHGLAAIQVRQVWVAANKRRIDHVERRWGLLELAGGGLLTRQMCRIRVGSISAALGLLILFVCGFSPPKVVLAAQEVVDFRTMSPHGVDSSKRMGATVVLTVPMIEPG